jgi:hypothetical protein
VVLAGSVAVLPRSGIDVLAFGAGLQCGIGESQKRREIYYVTIEPPDPDHLFYPKRGKITVDGLTEDPQNFPLFNHLQPKLPVGAFCCRFFVHDWNSFIHIAAVTAEFSWEITRELNDVQRS